MYVIVYYYMYVILYYYMLLSIYVTIYMLLYTIYVTVYYIYFSLYMLIVTRLGIYILYFILYIYVCRVIEERKKAEETKAIGEMNKLMHVSVSIVCVIVCIMYNVRHI